MSNPIPKPSPFSSLLSIKKRRMPGDSSTIDGTSTLGDTGQPTISDPERDPPSLQRPDAGAIEQSLVSDIQVPQTFSPTEHSVPMALRSYQAAIVLEQQPQPFSPLEEPQPSNIQPFQPVNATSQSQTSDIRTTQAAASIAHPMSPVIPVVERADDIQSHRAAGETALSDSTTQAGAAPVQTYRTSDATGATNPTAVRFARDPLGKRSHPGYTRMTVYVQKKTHDDFKLVADLAREEMSEIVEKLIGDYTQARKKELVRSFTG